MRDARMKAMDHPSHNSNYQGPGRRSLASSSTAATSRTAGQQHAHQNRRAMRDQDAYSNMSPSSPGSNSESSSSSSNRGGGASSSSRAAANKVRHKSVQDEIPLLGGEVIVASFGDITYLCPYSAQGSMKGTLTVTNYKLFFVSAALSKDCPFIMDVPLGFISRVEKVGGQRSSGENAYGLDITCKDVRSLRFALNKSEGHARKDIYETIRQHSFPVTYNAPFFAFQFTDRYPCDGWAVYDSVSELKRQGLPNESWKISALNERYEICETYPRYLGVPKMISDDQIRDTAKFRSKGRWPVLSWMHPDSLATICRSAQPLVGVGSNRSWADEKYVQAVMDANAQSHKIYIMDARPKVNSMVNVVNGGGYENEDCYQNAELMFLDIQNIHVMRESLRKVRDMCFPIIDDQRWLSNVDNTNWLNHLHHILAGAVKLADKVENSKTSVLVHCSDGWDRTAQLTSLAMLMLDPYYRSLKGFEVLIEKEWISFGHKFAHRIGHGVDKHNDNDRSPVFLQFIDCVWQISNQFPHSFEFNEYFLTFVLDHLYSCLFGTFLYNSDKERRHNAVQKNTQSLWSFVNHNHHMFMNPAYDDRNSSAIFPESSLPYMRLWTGYYCRWNQRMRPPHGDFERTRQAQLLSVKGQLKKKVDNLRKELDVKRRSRDFAGGGNSGGQESSVVITKYETVNI